MSMPIKTSSNPLNVGVEVVAVVTGCFLSGVHRSDPGRNLTAYLTSLIGAMMNLFLLTIPVLLETTQQTQQLLHQWTRVFYSGHRKGPGISIATGLIYGYAAWSKHAAGSPWRVFAVAGATTVSMIPYTWIVMQSTNNALFRAEARTKAEQAQSWTEAESLVKTWNRLNAVRALFPLAGAILGILGTVKLVVF